MHLHSLAVKCYQHLEHLAMTLSIYRTINCLKANFLYIKLYSPVNFFKHFRNFFKSKIALLYKCFFSLE